MTLNAVTSYMVGLIDGLTFPHAPGVAPLSAYVDPPAVTDFAQPLAYVWAAVGDETRQTSPRAGHNQQSSGAFKQAVWQVDICVYHLETPSDGSTRNPFPQILEGIMKVYRNSPMPIDITDPDTAVVSHLMSVGERIAVSYVVPDPDQDQASQVYQGKITVYVYEWFQA